eukprot:CAMPEP_0201520698 /NCGR_PEP_ID=MMETSP0161_2-20130828/12190_1 /ASSEMBLY_ACC=CAM_ASM_000251 /TAXON_ID=180227 /ORGANISM="Neoparamoeba aestuarina, Strain SoJaBio B1-5/56/2" /LENGTH=239 /DNA_ID=CAMNT_0047919167 /DNA_START=46 /DNA_END=765 /DNA_ORIENTATION=+
MNFVESILYFQPHDGKEDEVEALLTKATEHIQNEEGCLFYGAFRGDTGIVRVRGGYSGAEAFALHCQKEQQTMMAMMSLGNITKMQVHGPSEAEPILCPLVESQGGQFFTMSCGISRLPNKGMENAVDIVPYFTVQEGKIDEFKANLPKFVAATEGEKGCYYYGFSSRENVVRCIEAYADADAVSEHIGHVGKLLDEAFKISKLDLEFHGTQEVIDKLKPSVEKMNPRLFVMFAGYGKA